MNYKFTLKRDKYKKSRGGYSRLLDLSCASCQTHICFYQKDGQGMLKRLYLDRIFDKNFSPFKNLTCPQCKKLLGVQYIYQKENRPAYRLFAGAISKKIVKNR